MAIWRGGILNDSGAGLAGVLPNAPPQGIFGRIQSLRAQGQHPILDALGDHSNALLQFGLGLLSGQGNANAWANAAQGVAAGRASDQARVKARKEEERRLQQEASLRKALAVYGLDQNLASMPDVAAQVLGHALTRDPRDPHAGDFSLGNTRYTEAGVPIVTAPQPPVTEDSYDPATNAIIKQQWNPATGQWEKIGYGRPPSGMTMETTPEGGVTVTTGGLAGRPTATQLRNRQLYSVSVPELQRVEQTFTALSNLGNQAGNAVPLVNNFITSEDYQRGKNAVRSIIASYLYSTSGATANPSEIETQTEALMPQPGEKPAAVQDKLNRLRTYVEAIRIAAGIPDGQSSPQDNSNADQGGISPEGTEAWGPNGEHIIKRGGQWVPFDGQ